MKYRVDRIDEGKVICEDESGNILKLDASFAPDGVREGDILEATEKGFVILKDETAERRRKMAELQNSLFKKKKEE